MEDRNELVKIIQNDDVQSLISKTKSMTGIDAANIRITLSRAKEDKNSIQIIPEDGLTLLHVAAFYGALDCFRYLQLKRQIPLTKPSSHSFLPLHYACWAGSCEIALYILTLDPSEAKYIVQGGNDIQLLYCSFMGGELEIVQTLFNLGAPYDQNNLISKAISLRKIEFLKLIYKNFKSSKTSIDTPLAAKAVMDHNVEALEMLYSGKDDITAKIPEKLDDNLISLICYFDGNRKFKRFLVDRILKDAQDLDLEPKKPNIPGICHWACNYMDVEAAKEMFKLPGFNINRIVNNATGPSILANKRDKKVIEMLDFLIEYGFDINSNFDGKVPTLFESFCRGIVKNFDAIKFLIKKGADLNTHILGSEKSLYDFVMQGKDNKLKIIFTEARQNKKNK